MPSRNVAVQQAVYEALAREKRTGESFTGLFRRLLSQRQGAEELVGGWGPGSARADRKAFREIRGGTGGSR